MNTRLNVSCEGMLFAGFRNVLSQASLLRPCSAMPFQLSAQAITAHTVITSTPILPGRVHGDMRKLPAAVQEERWRWAMELRKSGLTFGAIAVRTGLTANRMSGICRRYAKRGLGVIRM